ncbi:MAG: hypothetical protein ACLR3C_07135 [Eggerthella lenta]
MTYLRTIFAFAPLFLLNNVLLPFVRNDGSPQLAMVAMLVEASGTSRSTRCSYSGSGGACSARRSPRGLLRS